MRAAGDRSAFLAGLEAGITSLDIHPENDALAEVSAVMAARGVLLLGETHGVEENAGVLAWCLRRFGPAQLGLEWQSTAGTVLQEFCDGGTVDVSRLRPSADGRITPQHFCAVRDLVREGFVTGVAAFAPEALVLPADDPSQNSWERALADRLLALRESAGPMVVMAGSVHTLVEPQPVRGPNVTPVGRSFAADARFEGRDVFCPMGWHVAREVPTVSVRLRYGAGSFTNFGRRVFASDHAISGNRLRRRGHELTVEVLHAGAAVVPDDDA